MTVVLVVLTVAGFIAIDWFLRHRRRIVADAAVALEPAAARAGDRRAEAAPALLHFHPGHSWVRVPRAGDVSIGTSAFASCFAGRLASVELPRSGARLHQGEPAWTLVSRKNRRLTQVMPVDGEVVEVNHALVRDPELAQREPYGMGWILRVRPSRLADDLHNLLHGGLAHAWDDATRLRLNEVLSPALGARANDGGEWVPGFGDELGEGDWQTLRRDLFPPEDDGIEA